MKENWIYKKFGEVFNLQMGKTPSRDNLAFWGGDNIWVSIADMKGKYIDSTKEHITDFAVSESKIHKVPQGTAIMSFKLTIGRAAIAKCDLFTNEAIMSFEPKDANILLPDYVFYYLKGCKWAGANKAVMGQTLNKKTISENTFAYPPLSTQSRIVAELDLLQSVIDKQKAQLKELDTIAQAIFYDMFGDPVENEKGWEVKKFDELCAIITDGEHATPRRSESGVYLLSARNIQNHKLDLKDVDYIDTEEYNRIAKRITPQKGDVLISCSGSVGRVCIAPDIKFQMVRSVALLRLIDSVCSVFFEYLICSDYVQNQINNSKVQVAQANLFQEKIRALNAIVPPLSLQQTFAAKIESIERQKAAISKSIAETEKLFDYTMDKYFG